MFEERLQQLTPLYSRLDLDYQNEYSGPYKDLSYQDENCVVIASIKKGQITGYGRPVVMIGTDKALKAQIERLYDISQDIWYIDFLENSRLSAVSRFLMQRGLAAVPYFSQIINLTKPETELHAAIRKSYKSICNSTLVDYSVVDVLRDIHIEMHERETRNAETWKLQAKMISGGQAFVLSDKKETSAALFYYNKYSAYYAVSASRGGQTHPLIWEAIKILKARGCRVLDLGEQVFWGNQKLINISRFKSGFGGSCKTKLILRTNEWKDRYE